MINSYNYFVPIADTVFPSLAEMFGQVLFRRYPEMFLKEIGKMRLGPETSHLTDFSQCIFPGQYKLGRAVETVCLKQIIRSGSCKCFDFPVEIGTGITQLAAKDIDVDITVGYVVFYVFVQFVEKLYLWD